MDEYDGSSAFAYVSVKVVMSYEKCLSGYSDCGRLWMCNA